MTSNRKKGLKKELLCANDLKKEGFEIWFRSTTVKRGPCWIGLDFADLFDVVGAHPEKGVYFISCKHLSSGHMKEHIAKIQSLVDAYDYVFRVAKFEIWSWNPPGYRGRGKNRHFSLAHWEKIRIVSGFLPISITKLEA